MMIFKNDVFLEYDEKGNSIKLVKLLSGDVLTGVPSYANSLSEKRFREKMNDKGCGSS